MLKKLAAFACLPLCALCAHADTFYFTYTGQGINASGTLVGEQTTQQGVYEITSIQGQRNGMAITGLNYVFGDPDELLYYPATFTNTALNPTYLDNEGFAYNVGTSAYNVFTSNTRPSVVEDAGGPEVDFQLSNQPAMTPEPASVALLGTGLLGVAGALRRKSRS